MGLKVGEDSQQRQGARHQGTTFSSQNCLHADHRKSKVLAVKPYPLFPREDLYYLLCLGMLYLEKLPKTFLLNDGGIQEFICIE